MQRETLPVEHLESITAQASVLDGNARLTTTENVSATATTIQPNFDTGEMQVSVPNDAVDAITFEAVDGELIVTITE